jgi:hypothetical protein
MTTATERWPAAGGLDAQADDLLVAVGLLSGAQLIGWLRRRGTGHVVDRLNNWVEPILKLETTRPGEASRAYTAVARSELAWVYPLQPGPGGRWVPTRTSPRQPDSGGTPAAPAVVAHIGAFEVRGTPQVFHQVDWAEFLLACSSDGRFFALTDARVCGPATDLQIPVLAVNAPRVAALVTPD